LRQRPTCVISVGGRSSRRHPLANPQRAYRYDPLAALCLLSTQCLVWKELNQTQRIQPTGTFTNQPFRSYSNLKMRSLTRRKSIYGHRFPMPHFSRRCDKRVEMGHRPQRGQSPLISSHMDVHSVRPSVGQHRGRVYVHIYGRTYIHTKTERDHIQNLKTLASL
jgi:hypothetical protein